MLELLKRIMVENRPFLGIMQANYNEYAQLKKVNININWTYLFHAIFYFKLIWKALLSLYFTIVGLHFQFVNVLGMFIDPLLFIMVLEFFAIEDLLLLVGGLINHLMALTDIDFFSFTKLL